MAERSKSNRLSQSDTVTLYGLSAARCAKCRRKLLKESEQHRGKIYNLGERAHILPNSDDGPRADPAAPAEVRAHLENHVLLCGTCHAEVDKDAESWPIERLEELRAEHMRWVDERLDGASVDPAELVYAKLIDEATERIWIDAWAPWTEYMLSPALSWRPTQVDGANDFRRALHVADWPATNPDLEVALCRLGHLVGEALETFLSRAERREIDLHVPRAYKRFVNPDFHRDATEFNAWLKLYEGFLFEATAAVNWVRATWRAAGNPEFMLGERAALVTGPHSDDNYRTHVEEYTRAQKEELLAAGRDAVASVAPWELTGPEDDGLDRLLGEIMESVLGEEPAWDVVEQVAFRIRSLGDAPTHGGSLFRDLPGRRIPAEKVKRINHELLKHGVLARNPGAQGFVLGTLPPPD